MRPIILLHKPQLGSNIGMVARAMLNCHMTSLRLIQPKEEWPNEKATKAAVGADIVLENAQIYSSLPDALADLTSVYALTARSRFMQKRTIEFHELPSLLEGDSHQTIGFLFGCESSGLTNEEIVLCNGVIHIPVNPEFPSLNLAQAVFAVCHRLFEKGFPEEKITPHPLDPLAPKKDIMAFYEHLERELDFCGFLYPPHKREKMVQNLRNIFQKSALTLQEVRTLRGVVHALRQGPHPKSSD